MLGVVDKVSLNRRIVFNAKSIFELLTSIFGQPDVWDRCIDKGEDSLGKELLALCILVGISDGLEAYDQISRYVASELERIVGRNKFGGVVPTQG